MHMQDHVSDTLNQRDKRTASGLGFGAIIAREQLDLLAAVNDERAAKGKPPVTLRDVRGIDESYRGQVDYAHKLGVRLQRLVRQ